jgi:hypothetical protein
MENKETKAGLNEMEGAKFIVEKEREQALIDLKSLQKRLENEKNRADTERQNFNTKVLELDRSKEIANHANKQLKFYSSKLEAKKTKIEKLKALLKGYQGLPPFGTVSSLSSSAVLK